MGWLHVVTEIVLNKQPILLQRQGSLYTFFTIQVCLIITHETVIHGLAQKPEPVLTPRRSTVSE